jgi:DNA repair exonuclease SbcCD ATPase subunit
MIKSIRLKNFRGIAEAFYEFGPAMNEIQGPNEIGKSTIDEAISFAFYGTDRAGNKNPDHLIQNGKTDTAVVIATGSAVFERKKKVGKTSTITLEQKGVPPITMNQSELLNLLGQDFNVFASAYRVGFFMSLPDGGKLEVINNILKVDRKSLLENHVSDPKKIPWRLVKLKSPRIDAEAVSRERRTLQNQLASAMGSMTELTAGDIQSRATVSDAEIAEKEAKLRPTQAKLELFSLYRREYGTYETQLARYEVELKNFQQAAKDIERTKLEIQSLPPPPNMDLTWEEQIKSHQAGIAEQRKKIAPAPTPPVSKNLPEGSCPTCGQVVPDKLKEQVAHDRDQALMAYNTLARQVADANTKYQGDIAHLEGLIDTIRQTAAQKKAAFESYNTKKKSLEETLARLQRAGEPVAPNKPQEPEHFSQESEYVKAASELQAAISGAKLFIQQRENNRRRYDELTAQTNDLKQQIEPLEEVENVLKRLPEIEIQETKAKLAIPDVSVELVEGALDVRVNGVPYSSLSSGRAIKTDFKWAAKVQELMHNAPGFYFCDNVDLVDRFDGALPTHAQIFFARVKPELKELRVVQM